MGFWIAGADTAGVRITASEEMLDPGPAEVQYPVDPAGRTVETTGGAVVRQSPNADPRRRAWVWHNLPTYQPKYNRFIVRLESLLAMTRRTRGLSPWVYLKDDVTAELRKWVFVSGTATGVTVNTLDDSTKTWTVNALKDGVIDIVSGTGAGQRRSIASNTATSLTVTDAWAPQPTGATYSLQYSESAWFRARVTAVSKSPVPQRGTSYETIRLDFVIDDSAFNYLG